MRKDGQWSGSPGGPGQARIKPVRYQGSSGTIVRRTWLEADDRVLIKLRSNGIAPDLAAEAMGRTYSAVVSRTRGLSEGGVIVRNTRLRNAFDPAPDWERRLKLWRGGQQGRGGGQDWSASGDEAAIVDLSMEGLYPAEIASRMGGRRTAAAVQNRLVKLRQTGELAPARRRWSRDELATFEVGFLDGLGDERLALALNRSASAVIKRRRDMGLLRRQDGLPELDRMTVVPFFSADAAVLWAVAVQDFRANATTLKRGFARCERPCEPTDVLTALARLGLSQLEHRMVIAYARSGSTPGRKAPEADVRFWQRVMDKLTTVLASKGIVRLVTEWDGENR